MTGHVHDWRFDGDDPHLICACGKRQDPLTGLPEGVHPHSMYPGGPVCPCPAYASAYHHWFNQGRTVGMHEMTGMSVERLRRAIDEALSAMDDEWLVDELAEAIVAEYVAPALPS